jgi:hypothetical protein
VAQSREKVLQLDPFWFIALDLTCDGFYEAQLRTHEIHDFLAFRLQGIRREKPQLSTMLLITITDLIMS